MSYPANFSQLIGDLAVTPFDPKRIESSMQDMQELGYAGIYPGDLFLHTANRDDPSVRGRLIFEEDDGWLVQRSDEEVDQLRQWASRFNLTMESAHFNQTHQPPGLPADWIFERHQRQVELAARAGLKRFTTHIGWMYGLVNEEYMGDAAAAFRAGKINQAELNQIAIEKSGGLEKVHEDAIQIYRNLCRLCAPHGITPTVETAVPERYDLTLDGKALRGFIREVGEPNLGICVDAGHCHMNGLDPAQVIRDCGEDFIETHFHDNFGGKDLHNPIGIGTVDWRAILQAMQDVQYSGAITFEQKDYRDNIRNWRSFLERSPREDL